MLSNVAGESGATGWYKIHSEQGLRRFATLLREHHEAVEDFQPGPDLEWAVQPSDPLELVCHNDFGPWNLVYLVGRGQPQPLHRPTSSAPIATQ